MCVLMRMRAQAFDAETLDETHAAHVGGEVIDFHRAFADALAIVLDAHVEAEVLHAGHVQIPFVKRLLVHRADVGEAFFGEIQGEVAGDESAGAGDDDQVVLFQWGVFFNESFCFHKIFSKPDGFQAGSVRKISRRDNLKIIAARRPMPEPPPRRCLRAAFRN